MDLRPKTFSGRSGIWSVILAGLSPVIMFYMLMVVRPRHSASRADGSRERPPAGGLAPIGIHFV